MPGLRARLGRLPLLVWAVVASLPLAGLAARSWLVREAASSAVGWLLVSLPPVPPSARAVSEVEAGSPLDVPAHWDLEHGALGGELGPSGPSIRGARRQPQDVDRSVRASVEVTRRWIERKAIPRGRGVAPTRLLPAGVAIEGVAAYGLGLTDRDRLVNVAGQPVTSPGEVVEAVLRAVGGGAPSIQGSFLHESGGKVIRTTVIVDLPDLGSFKVDDSPRRHDPSTAKR